MMIDSRPDTKRHIAQVSQVTVSHTSGFKRGDAIVIGAENYKITACSGAHILTVRKLHVWDRSLDLLRFAVIHAWREFCADADEWWEIEDRKRGISRGDSGTPPPSPWLDEFEHFLKLWHRSYRGDA